MSTIAGEKGARGGKSPAASDPTYNLISVLYHALKGADLYAEFIADAEADGDDELRDFFQQVREEEDQRALRARQLLAERLELSGESSGMEDEELDNAAE